jgi:hypothetical protein
LFFRFAAAAALADRTETDAGRGQRTTDNLIDA